MNIKGAIFDMDGTLLSSMHVWYSLGERFLRSRGIVSESELDDKLKNMTVQQSAHYLQDVYGVQESIEEIIQDYFALMGDFYRNEAQLKEGVLDYLMALRAHHIPFCIASATDTYLVKEAMNHLGILELFEGVLCTSEVGKGKDHPDIYLQAAQLLGTETEHTWVFEDALYAARTAKAAGFPLAVVYDEYERQPEEIKALADLYISSFKDLSIWE